MMRMAMAQVCQPLAHRPPKTEAVRGFVVQMEGLRVELAGEGDDGFAADGAAFEVHHMADGEVFPTVAVGACGVHGRPA